MSSPPQFQNVDDDTVIVGPVDKDAEGVLVTGITGYIATETVKVLCDYGFKNIRGTVRSVEKGKTQLVKLFRYAEEKGVTIELYKADLTDKHAMTGAIIEPMKNGSPITRILHLASPYPANPKTAEEVLIPAIDGTMVVMEQAASEASKVKQVILCGSIYGLIADAEAKFLTFTQIDGKKMVNVDEKTYGAAKYCSNGEFNPSTLTSVAKSISPAMSYPISKAMAEQSAWKFWKESAKQKFHFCTILPGAVWGISDSQVLSKGQLGTSMSYFGAMLNGELNIVPKYCNAICSVEDVAEYHVRAIGNAACNGHRFISFPEFLWFSELGPRAQTVFDTHRKETGEKLMWYNPKARSIAHCGRMEGTMVPVKKLFGKTAPYFVAKTIEKIGMLPPYLVEPWGVQWHLDDAWKTEQERIMGHKCKPIQDFLLQMLKNYNAIMLEETPQSSTGPARRGGQKSAIPTIEPLDSNPTLLKVNGSESL